jgi:hypothetical protein
MSAPTAPGIAGCGEDLHRQDPTIREVRVSDRSRPRLWRHRFAVIATLVGLTMASVAVVAAPASADAGHCDPTPAQGGLADFHFKEDRWLRTFKLESATDKIFIPQFTLFSVNGAEQDALSTLMVTQTKTESVTNSFGFNQSVTVTFNKFVAETSGVMFGQETTESTSTAVGASKEVSVPARGRVEADYGIEVIDVTILMKVYFANEPLPGGGCRFQNQARAVVRVPTTGQGFGDERFWPVINRNGIANGVTYGLGDIRAGTTVAIFGQYFDPQDTVIVTQGTNTFNLTFGNNDWWYDSDRQINATLPSGLQPGTANFRVRTSQNRTSNTRSITIQPPL